MQSVGEAMAIGRTFNEALQKGLRSLEIGVAGLETAQHAARETARAAAHRRRPSASSPSAMRSATG